jgi:hypothetical protein
MAISSRRSRDERLTLLRGKVIWTIV